MNRPHPKFVLSGILFAILLACSPAPSKSETIQRINELFLERMKIEVGLTGTQSDEIRKVIESVQKRHPVTQEKVAAAEKLLRLELGRKPLRQDAVEAALVNLEKLKEAYRERGEVLEMEIKAQLSIEQKARYVLFQKDFFRRLAILREKAKN